MIVCLFKQIRILLSKTQISSFRVTLRYLLFILPPSTQKKKSLMTSNIFSAQQRFCLLLSTFCASFWCLLQNAKKSYFRSRKTFLENASHDYLGVTRNTSLRCFDLLQYTSSRTATILKSFCSIRNLTICDYLSGGREILFMLKSCLFWKNKQQKLWRRKFSSPLIMTFERTNDLTWESPPPIAKPV